MRLSSDSAVRGLGLEQTVELGSPLGAQQGLDQGVRSLLCATARRTDKSYDSVGCWKDEPLGAQPLTCEAKENLRSLVLKGPFEPAKLRVLPSSRDRSIEKPLAPSVGLNLVRADLELVRDKAGGRSRSGAQIARNEAEVAKDTKLKREPQAVCCPPPEGDEVPVGTRQRACSDQVIARDFLGKAGPPSQLKSLRR